MGEPILHILTGEYPPRPGGVGDYCAQVAAGLAAEGRGVHVWCPGRDARRTEASGVEVHRVARLFSPGGLGRLARALDRWPAPRSLLLQYTPNALGVRGMNVPLCVWLLMRSRRDDVRVMFHEPYFYFGWRRPHRNVLAVVQRLMAVLLLGASRRVYLSSATWERSLSPYMWLGGRQLMWLPIPSNVPRCENEVAIERCRLELTGGSPDTPLIGHFGTYGDQIRPLLEACLAGVAARLPGLCVACLGRHGETFVAGLEARVPSLRGRVVASGGLAPEAVAAHLRACDLVVQPFPDGVTTRRTSLMASLVNGCPTVTTIGPLTEPLWTDESGVAMAPVGDTAALVDLVVGLLRDEARRAALGRAGYRLYDTRFALRHTVRHLSDQPGHPVPVRAAR
ncbi:MAG: glycosyltransferase family 4 protein [Acidobacteria bacterium]|nr:glycosyltransferase family 4 protein [Acidobacteriota bacterium]